MGPRRPRSGGTAPPASAASAPASEQGNAEAPRQRCHDHESVAAVIQPNVVKNDWLKHNEKGRDFDGPRMVSGQENYIIQGLMKFNAKTLCTKQRLQKGTRNHVGREAIKALGDDQEELD